MKIGDFFTCKWVWNKSLWCLFALQNKNKYFWKSVNAVKRYIYIYNWKYLEKFSKLDWFCYWPISKSQELWRVSAITPTIGNRGQFLFIVWTSVHRNTFYADVYSNFKQNTLLTIVVMICCSWLYGSLIRKSTGKWKRNQGILHPVFTSWWSLFRDEKVGSKQLHFKISFKRLSSSTFIPGLNLF